MENPMFLGRKIKNERKEKSHTAKDVYGGVGNIELANHEILGILFIKREILIIIAIYLIGQIFVIIKIYQRKLYK